MASADVGVVEANRRFFVAAHERDGGLHVPVHIGVRKRERDGFTEACWIDELQPVSGVVRIVLRRSYRYLNSRVADSDDVPIFQDDEVDGFLVAKSPAAGVQVFEQEFRPGVYEHAVGVAYVVVMEDNVGRAARTDERNRAAKVPRFLSGCAVAGRDSHQGRFRW